MRPHLPPSLRFRIFAGLAAGALLLHAGGAAAQDSPRQRLSLDANWRFQKDDPAEAQGKLNFNKVHQYDMATGSDLIKAGTPAPAPTGNPGGDITYAQPAFDDSGWRQLDVPHDWAIEGPFEQDLPGSTGKLPWTGIGWYRKHFTLPASGAGKDYYVDFDGAMAYSMVWINGKFAGGWPYGYSSWELDVTPYVQAGDNVISVRLENPPDSSRWYPGSGIYRSVWLVSTSPTHIGHWGVYITTPAVSADSATVQVSVDVKNAPAAGAAVQTEVYASGSDGTPVGSAVAKSDPAPVSGGDSTVKESPISLSNPKLWSIDSPNRYVAVTTVTAGGQAVDREQDAFGVRTIKFDANQGFFLNGQHVKLNGVCDHQDQGALGDAINPRALQRQIELLKEMGCNAIRTSHNPPAPELIELCDRMGVVVMDESFDCWERGKTTNGYNLLYDDWHERDLRALVRRDRNHPCVIMWSIGNEIPDERAPKGAVMAKELTGIAHEEDPTRPTSLACDYTPAGYSGYQKGVDVFGYNYKPTEYPKFHAANPDIPLFGSETASCVSTRGEYFFPVSWDKSQGKEDFHVSSYDLYAPPWATPPDWEFAGQDKNAFVAGEFVWTGFDYIGEPTPYDGDSRRMLNFTDPEEQAKAAQELQNTGRITVPSRSSYFGILDLAGFKKDRFYIYQAVWRPDYPMAHILPHWNWPERVGQVTPVHVYTSGDEGELFLNGKSLGVKKKGPYEYRLHWDDVVYEPGELKVVVSKNGRPWATDVMKTTGPAAKLLLSPDRATIKADGQDLSYVTVSVADKDGLMVPRTHNQMELSVSGPAEIAGVDNGDPTSHDSFQGTKVKAFNGLALVILRSKPGTPGAVTLHATSDGLDSGEATIQTQ